MIDICYSIDQLPRIATEILSLQQFPIFSLKGPIGAGKTSLVQHIAQSLGVTTEVQSPTFTFMKEYLLPNGEYLVHMDWYRLDNIAELESLGWEEFMEGADYIFIEWAQRFPYALEPFDFHNIELEIKDANHRHISMT